MAEYDNTNTGTLFRNDKGDNPKRPDYTGKADVDGTEYRLSAWIKEGKSGKFMSIRFELPRDAAKPKAAAPAAAGLSDDIPF